MEVGRKPSPSSTNSSAADEPQLGRNGEINMFSHSRATLYQLFTPDHLIRHHDGTNTIEYHNRLASSKVILDYLERQAKLAGWKLSLARRPVIGTRKKAFRIRLHRLAMQWGNHAKGVYRSMTATPISPELQAVIDKYPAAKGNIYDVRSAVSDVFFSVPVQNLTEEMIAQAKAETALVDAFIALDEARRQEPD